MYRPKSSIHATLLMLVVCIVVTGFLTACSGSGGNVQATGAGPVDNMPAGTGGIAFQLAFQQPGPTQAMRTPGFNSCVDYGLGTITATVMNGTTTVTSTSWPCALHQGVVTGVPAGSAYTVRVQGLASGTGTALWSGQTASIAVTTGQVTNAGTIVMTYIGTDFTAPAVTQIAANSSPTNTTSVPITDRFNIAFSKSMAISTLTSTNITMSGSVAGTVAYNSTNNTASFIPSAPLQYNTQYTLQVVSCVTGSCIKDLAGNVLTTGPTNTFIFTTEAVPTAVASAPTLTTKAGNSQVTLDWPAVNGATSYNVYWSTVSGVTPSTGTLLANVSAPAMHLGLANGTTYYYVVTAVTNTSGSFESAASSESSATPAVPASNPSAPANLSVVFNSNGPYVVSWPTATGMSYNLYWSPRAIYPDHTAADNVVRYVPGGTYSHSGVQNGVTYCYIVTALSAAGESSDSNQVCGPGAGSIQIIWP